MTGRVDTPREHGAYALPADAARPRVDPTAPSLGSIPFVGAVELPEVSVRFQRLARAVLLRARERDLGIDFAVGTPGAAARIAADTSDLARAVGSMFRYVAALERGDREAALRVELEP